MAKSGLGTRTVCPQRTELSGPVLPAQGQTCPEGNRDKACAWWRWDPSQRGEVQLGCVPLPALGDGCVFLAGLGSHLMGCSCKGSGGCDNTSSSALLQAPQGFLLLEVENAESCHDHNASPKSQCPHSVIPCPGFPLYFLASGLLLS